MRVCESNNGCSIDLHLGYRWALRKASNQCTIRSGHRAWHMLHRLPGTEEDFACSREGRCSGRVGVADTFGQAQAQHVPSCLPRVPNDHKHSRTLHPLAIGVMLEASSWRSLTHCYAGREQFRVLQCKTVGDKDFHEDDYTIDCSSTRYHLVYVLSICLIVLIPVGVPAGFLYFMNRARVRLGGKVECNSLGGAKLSGPEVSDEDDTYSFLTSDYHPHTWFYELVTCMPIL